MPAIGLGLGDFVGVVGESVVYAAAVDIEPVAELAHGNGAALDVPTGVSEPPRRLPLELLILELGLCEPEHEIRLVALGFIETDVLARSDEEIVLVVLVENIVFVELGRVEVDVSAGYVGVALVEQNGDHLYEVRYAARRGNDRVGLSYVELLAVGKEGVGIEFRYLEDGLVLAFGPLEHLVLAGIRVAREVADVCDVHDAAHVEPAPAHVLFKYVLHDVAAQVAYMGKVVDGRTAGVHPDDAGLVWNEFVLAVSCAVIELHLSLSLFSRASSLALRAASSAVTGSGTWIWSTSEA